MCKSHSHSRLHGWTKRFGRWAVALFVLHLLVHEVPLLLGAGWLIWNHTH